jgi:hypothetical protein
MIMRTFPTGSGRRRFDEEGRAAVCAADPFHNPNLSLTGPNEWALAVPLRVSLDEPRYQGPP